MRTNEAAPPAETTRRFEVEPGLSLHVRVLGGPTALGARRPGAILLHGGGQTGASWGHTAAALATRGFEVWAPDQRGHGESDRSSGGDYRVDTFVADLRAMVLAFPEPPIVIGASLGGMASLLLAGGEDPPPLRALVLVDIALGAMDAGVDRILGFMRSTAAGFASIDEAREAIARYAPQRAGGTDEGLRRVLRRRGERWVWHWDPRLLDGFDVGAVVNGGRLRDAAARVRLPVMLVRGGASDVVSVELAEELAHTIPGARWVDVRNVGHMVAGDDNDAFTAAVLRFIAEL